jgi:hypothetical protein
LLDGKDPIVVAAIPSIPSSDRDQRGRVRELAQRDERSP